MLSKRNSFIIFNYFLFFFTFFYSKNYKKKIKNNNRTYKKKEIKEEKTLKKFLEKRFDENYFNGKKLKDFLNKKINKMNFNEAAAVYITCFEKNEKEKVKLLSLKRMYQLCSDSRLAEYILWEFGNLNLKLGKFVEAYECFSFFKKLFPGSKFYWEARLKEIETLFKLNLNYRLDDTNNKTLIDLCRQYEYDISFLEKINKEDYLKILKIMRNCYINEINKNLNIAKDYYNRSRYMRTPESLLSVFLRLDELSEILKEAILYDSFSDEIFFKDNFYEEILNFVSKKLELYFLNLNLKVPSGKDYISDREDAITFLNINFKKVSELSKEAIDLIAEKIKKY